MRLSSGKISIMTKPAAVLWDMDGTIVDSEHYWLSSEQELAASAGKIWTEQDGINMIGMSLYDSSRLIKQKLDLELETDEIIERLTNSVISKLDRSLPWRPGAKELLKAVRDAGIPTALVTMSMRRNADAVVARMGFDAFDEIIAGDQVVHGKPHPEPYLKAAEKLGVNIEHCIAFEDSISGLHSAEASGAIAIGVPNLVQIPNRPGRILWPTLTGVTVADLQEIYRERRMVQK
jgi:HAD superfamily hydrolase (TIGR01509 family)